MSAQNDHEHKQRGKAVVTAIIESTQKVQFAWKAYTLALFLPIEDI